jgi:hypothetical protein
MWERRKDICRGDNETKRKEEDRALGKEEKTSAEDTKKLRERKEDRDIGNEERHLLKRHRN